MARLAMSSRVFYPWAFDGWALANHMAARVVTTRLTLLGTSQQRITCVGVSEQRLSLHGTSQERLSMIGSSPQ